MVDDVHGAKCHRLLSLRESSDLQAHVPAIVPVPAETELDARDGDRVDRYARLLAQRRPRLLDEVRATCGPLPWIVRSSGREDRAENLNAGGYLSLPCSSESELGSAVARVALSGFSERARRQSALSDQGASPAPIPTMVQPLLATAIAPGIEADEVPYLESSQLARVGELIAAAARVLGMAELDCEWGLETDCGFVSATSVTQALAGGRVVGRLAFGFGFASAQSPEARPNSVVFLPRDSQLQLWLGERLRRVELQRIWILQARPAIGADLTRRFEDLTQESAQRLSEQLWSAAVTSIVRGKRPPWGRFLRAPTLASAWRAYLELAQPEREALSLVVVEQGSALEHAGLMFQQEQLTCLRGELAELPAGATHAVSSRGRSYFGSESMLAQLRLEQRTLLDLPADSHLVFSDPALADETAALAALAALPLDAPTAGSVRRLSCVPSDRHWLAAAGRVTSPSLFAQKLERTPGLAVAGAAEAHYRRAFLLAHRGTVIEEVLPHFAKLWRPEHDRLLASGDLRLPLALVQLDQGLPGVAEETLRALLDAAAQHGPRVLEAVRELAEATLLLPIYEEDERRAYVEKWVAALAGGTPLLQRLDLAPPALARLAAATVAEPRVGEALGALLAAQAEFLAAFPTAGLISSGGELNRAWQQAEAALAGWSELADVTTLVRGNIIELYDATLKKLLERLPDEAIYRRYLALLGEWIGFARLRPLAQREEQALDAFAGWLRRREGEPPPRELLIEDRNWKVELAAAAAGDALEYENAHVVHNLLHQWLLATNVVGASLLPRRLQQLVTFAARFSDRNSKLLRFGRNAFEIEVPMGTHKASFGFEPSSVNVEWTEPPDCPGEEIARILAFELLLERYSEWYPQFRIRYFREQVVGTWTLFIRARPRDAEILSFEEMLQLLQMIRFLFDAAYDFSYVENRAVDGLRESLADPAWREIFAGLIGYRASFDDLAQYVHLHTLAMSTALHSIARDGEVRRMLLGAHRGAFKGALSTMERTWKRLMDTTDEEKWAGLYEQLRQITLLLASLWPRQSFAFLERAPRLHGGHDLLASSLLRRLDLRSELLQQLRSRRPSLAGLWGLALRHVPSAVIDADNAPELAALVGGHRKAFKRAKHYLLTCFAERLPRAQLKRLVSDVEFLPWGAGAAQESLLASLAARKPRYPLNRGVDWTQLKGAARS